jgi:hypothetical protein
MCSNTTGRGAEYKSAPSEVGQAQDTYLTGLTLGGLRIRKGLVAG